MMAMVGLTPTPTSTTPAKALTTSLFEAVALSNAFKSFCTASSCPTKVVTPSSSSCKLLLFVDRSILFKRVLPVDKAFPTVFY